MRTCDCSYCIGGRQKAYDLVCVDDFYEEVNYAPRKKKKSNPFPKKKGCPALDNEDHVWVWTSEYVDDYFSRVDFYKVFGYHKHIEKRCVACLKKDKSEYTERYQKRLDKWISARRAAGLYVPWRPSWENDDPRYQREAARLEGIAHIRKEGQVRFNEFLKSYRTRHGF